MSEKAPKTERRIKSPREKAEQVRRIATKLLERADLVVGSYDSAVGVDGQSFHRSGVQDVPRDEGYGLAGGRSFNSNKFTTNENGSTVSTTNTVLIRDNGNVRLAREYHDNDESNVYVTTVDADKMFAPADWNGLDIGVSEVPVSNDFRVKHLLKTGSRDAELRINDTQRVRAKVEEASPGKRQELTDGIDSATSISAKILADARNSIATTAIHQKAERAKRQDLVSKVLR